jgi:hypothetical protein
MIRLSRPVLGAVLVIGVGCSGTPTAPKQAPNMIAPDAAALVTSSDTTCRSGYSVTNGKGC